MNGTISTGKLFPGKMSISCNTDEQRARYAQQQRLQSCEQAVIAAAEALTGGTTMFWGSPGEPPNTCDVPIYLFKALVDAQEDLHAARKAQP